jgi:cell wall-associated NlpC family hydrolase
MYHLSILFLIFISITLIIHKTYSKDLYDFESLIKEIIKEEYLNNDDTSSASQCAVEYVIKQVGKCYSQQDRFGPYCFDCSGLIYKAYQNCGKSVPTSTSQYPSNGSSTLKLVTNVQPGDIIHRYGNPYGHVAIYIGNNRMVHAANTNLGVIESTYKPMERIFRVQ